MNKTGYVGNSDFPCIDEKFAYKKYYDDKKAKVQVYF
jgi:hypothetical protein